MSFTREERKILIIIAAAFFGVMAVVYVVIAFDNYRTNRFVEDQVESATELLHGVVEDAAQSGKQLEQELAGNADEIRRQSSQAKRERDKRADDPRKTLEAQRAGTKMGKTLFRKCKEYSDFYRNTPGPFAQQQQDEACRNYKAYIATGIAPPTY